MAGDWIKMRSNLWDDPRVTSICEQTDCGEATIIGGLYWLWATADQHSSDGVMLGLTLRGIDRKTGIPGLGSALVSLSWLSDHPEGVRLMRFDEHNGASAKNRMQTAIRVANHKINIKVTPTALPDSPPGVTDALPRIRVREEKSLEATSNPLGAAAPTETDIADDPAAVAEPVVPAVAAAPLPAVPAAAPAAPVPAATPAPAAVLTAQPADAGDFERAFAAYPARCGGNPKADAQKSWNARIKDGVAPADMLAGAERYAAFNLAAGKTGTEFVMQAVRFFGKSRHYAELWKIDAPPAGRNSRSTAAMGSNALAFDDPFMTKRATT